MFAHPTSLLTALVATLTLASASPSARTDAVTLAARAELGGVDVARACQAQNGIGWAVQRIGNAPGDWKCEKNGEWRDVGAGRWRGRG